MTTRPIEDPADVSPATSNSALLVDFLTWLAIEPRPYAEVMDVWRTSCPRLTIWEDAVDQGLVRRRRDDVSPTPMVALTDLGRSAVAARRLERA